MVTVRSKSDKNALAKTKDLQQEVHTGYTRDHSKPLYEHPVEIVADCTLLRPSAIAIIPLVVTYMNP